MKIGMALSLEVSDPDSGEVSKYRSKIIDQNEQYLFINLPIDTHTNKTTFFREGTQFTAVYIGDGQSVQMFKTQAAGTYRLDNIPALAIQLPDAEQIKTIQRRRFIRVKTAVDVAVHGKNLGFTTVTQDISAGGLSIVLPTGINVKEKEMLTVWLVLIMRTGEYQYIHAAAEVIRIDQGKDGSRLSLKFKEITNAAQQKIIRFCFDEQLRTRRKELS
ncbi:pilus assembly protein PilZ [Lentibacillus cibarius]|uniref:Pilus assembly protein PilZ n=1 Tax=Lentibacillus cibarius TaxID=2583219 RepID=A0A549YL33_9BACI|nr:PilZ domain-containing protein [Lentibacillus cibarius]TRM12589.1 pilus assembly protein PilZ [Lentibacillus cibarius]